MSEGEFKKRLSQEIREKTKTYNPNIYTHAEQLLFEQLIGEAKKEFPLSEAQAIDDEYPHATHMLNWYLKWFGDKNDP